MFIKLTNAAEQHQGNPIYINPDYISAVYESAKEKDGAPITRVFGGPTGVEWQVVESMSEVMNMINPIQTNELKRQWGSRAG